MKFISKIIDFFAPAFVPSERDFFDSLVEIEMNDHKLSLQAVRGGPHCTILYVSPTTKMAQIRARQMGYPYTMHFIGAGQALMGSQFDEVIIDQDCIPYLHDKGWSQQKVDDYIATAVICRVGAGGRVRYLQ